MSIKRQKLIEDEFRMIELIVKMLNTDGEVFRKHLAEYTILFNNLNRENIMPIEINQKKTRYTSQGIIEKKIDLSDRNTNGRFSNNYRYTTLLVHQFINLRTQLKFDGITKKEVDGIIEHISIHFENLIEYLDDAAKLTESQDADVPHPGEE